MFLNHLNAVEYGVRLLKGWSVKRGSTGASAVKSRMNAAFNVMGSEVSLKTITLPVTIKGRDQHEAAARLSAWEAALAGGKVELQLPDGFYYDAYLKSCGEPSYDLPWLISNTYVLEGVQRGPLLSLKAQPDVPFTVKGTAPRIGCRITATVPRWGSFLQRGRRYIHRRGGGRHAVHRRPAPSVYLSTARRGCRSATSSNGRI